MNKKLLFSATIGDIRYLNERGYLSKEGQEWLDSLLNIDQDYDTKVECEQ